MRTAIELTGLNEKRIRRWAAQGRLRIYRVEGVGTPRYDLEQLQALARGEPPHPPGNGARDGIMDLGHRQLVLALDQVLDQALGDGGLDGDTAALLRVVRTRLATSGSSSSRYPTWRQAAQRWSRAA
jgi:hypothetical protein